MSQRIDYARQAPELFKKYLDFSLALKKSGLEPGLQHLVTLRASQLNGCAFCVDMHVKEARIDGERELRLHHVAVWHESAAVLGARARRPGLDRTADAPARQWRPRGGLPAVRDEFNEQELSALSFAIVGINGWNRLAIGFASVPGSMDKAYGLEKSGLA